MLTIWPDEVETTMITNKHTSRTMNDIDHHSCHAYVYQVLCQLRVKSTRYQSQLKVKEQALRDCFT
jgi:hypothetical protein